MSAEKNDEDGVRIEDLDDADRSFLAQIFQQISLNNNNNNSNNTGSTPARRECPLLINKPLQIDSVAELLRTGAVRRVVVLTGAGVSVAAGIPDFRTPGTGCIVHYNLCSLAKEMFPGSYRPTAAHFFIALLAKKQLLLRNFTQNIDTLERVASVPPEYLVEAHGSFGGAHCINCHASMSIDDVKAAIVAEQIPRCASCNGYVKPDIVFFGESLPKRYFELSMSDLPRADLLLVLGTSLKVQPFASLIDHVDDKCPRVLINREAVGLASGDGDQDIFHFGSRGGFVFDGPTAYRDIFCEGDVQDSVLQLVKLCGWKDELQELMDEFDKKNKKPEAVTSSTTTTATTTTTTSSSSSSSSSTSSAAASTTAVAIKREQEKAAENEHSESEAEESRQ